MSLMKRYVMILLTCMLLLAGCASDSKPPAETTPIADVTQDNVQTPVISQTEKPIPVDPVEEMLSKMTLEEKVGQMFFIACRRDADGNPVITADDAVSGLIARYHPGGFVLFAENISTIPQTQGLIQGLQDASKIPLFISVDEEGGIVSRLNKAQEMHSTKMPDAYTIGLTDNPDYAYQVAEAIAQELYSLGFNMDFAPVCDIFTNPDNTVIGKRAYGSEPAKVSLMVSRAVEGFKDGQIIPVLKHFPGHGDTLADSHTGAAEVTHDRKRLDTTELIPFMEGIEAGAEVIMTAHILLPNITKEQVPASLSSEIITGILRENMGFDGIVITDALEMSAIAAFFEEDEAVVKAVEAGVDMLLMPSKLDNAYAALLKAVSDGRISEARIDESVRRILALKMKYQLLSGEPRRPDPEEVLGSEEHQELARKIREDAKP